MALCVCVHYDLTEWQFKMFISITYRYIDILLVGQEMDNYKQNINCLFICVCFINNKEKLSIFDPGRDSS